jgi:16S rRNA (adenine1518-N6/adenine1519-N6)-dimethyltransferase
VSREPRSGSLKAQILDDLATAGCQPLHRFGQNFMVDSGVVDGLVGALGPITGRRVLEVGPGTGVLTTRLLDGGAQVLAVEIDRGLAAHLERTLVPRGLQLVVGDVLATKGCLHPAVAAWAADGPWMLAANLPYDVAIPVLTECAALPRQPEAMAATVQYECGRRLCSRPGDDAWGASAAVLQAAGTPRLVRRVGRDAFHPRPNVDSAVIGWTPLAALPPGFSTWVRAIFAYRRKVLPRALMDTGLTRDTAEAACRAAGLDATRRVEGLDAPEMTSLFAAVRAASPEPPCASPPSP